LIAAALRRGEPVDDRDFDQLLPAELRTVSSQYWTPLAVAARAAQWFEELGVQRVVDIGSGAGKFCVAAALAGTASYVGLEHRLALVVAARALAKAVAVEDKVEFVHGTPGDLSALRADAYYLFNPFAENWYPVDEQLDAEVELGPERASNRARSSVRLRWSPAARRAWACGLRAPSRPPTRPPIRSRCARRCAATGGARRHRL
jgi:SAM-dependent methyltransferase